MERLKLSDDDKRMLDGSRGPARQKAMEFTVRFARVLNVPELCSVTWADLFCGAHHYLSTERLLGGKMINVIHGRGVLGGVVEAPALISRQTVTGWDGVDVNSGCIVEPHHPLEGMCIADRVLILEGSKGSNGWSIFFHAAQVSGFGPAALVFPRLDSRTAVTAAALNVPLVTDLDQDPFELIGLGDLLRVDANEGTVSILERAAH